MSSKQNQSNATWGGRIVKSLLAILLLTIAFDFGKHFILKRTLENEIALSQGVITLDSMSISIWPFLQSHLILKNFHVNVSGTPLAATTVTIRQGWRDWRLAHIQAQDVKSAETLAIQDARGILDTAELRSRVKVSELVLTGINAKLPLLEFGGSRASFDFLYEMGSHQLSLKTDAPDLFFANGIEFGLSGEGTIDTKAPIHGKMDVKIRNIDKMLKELVTAGVIDASQAGLVTAGSEFLGKIGLHDLTLPLKIEDGEVFLGPVPLFKVGKS
ncbi:MAG: DUF2125 domain-containing protein [Alphaproteobacteria bacterium]|jgi:hypothetical protein|nr:DUF2125 domain-containing protein [Alphaproteobacteria bacterium]